MAGDRDFVGSIPALYDRYLGPLLFQPYADDLAARFADVEAGALLEVAAGTGIVTRTLASRLPASVAITATDLNQAMIDYAASVDIARPVAWRQADALHLPYPDRSFDIVTCAFGVMFFPDKVAAYREARRVLKPGGRFLFNVWDSVDANAFAAAIRVALETVFPEDPPRFMDRTPHGYHDAALIRAELAAAGFAASAVERVARAGLSPSPRDVAIGFCEGSPIRNEVEARPGGRLAELTATATAIVAERFGQGPVEGALSAFVFSATA